KTPPRGRFAFLAEREVWTNPLVRQIRRERIWTAEGWPRSAQREGVGPMDGPNNPRGRHATVQRIEADALRFWRKGKCGRTLSVIRPILGLTLRAIGCAGVRSGILPPQSTNSSVTNLDSRRLAPQREARRGLAHGWAKQSLPLRQPRTSFDSAALRSGRKDF